MFSAKATGIFQVSIKGSHLPKVRMRPLGSESRILSLMVTRFQPIGARYMTASIIISGCHYDFSEKVRSYNDKYIEL